MPKHHRRKHFWSQIPLFVMPTPPGNIAFAHNKTSIPTGNQYDTNQTINATVTSSVSSNQVDCTFIFPANSLLPGIPYAFIQYGEGVTALGISIFANVRSSISNATYYGSIPNVIIFSVNNPANPCTVVSKGNLPISGPITAYFIESIITECNPNISAI